MKLEVFPNSIKFIYVRKMFHEIKEKMKIVGPNEKHIEFIITLLNEQ